MEEKKSIKIGLSTFFLMLAIIVILVMGIYIYKITHNTSSTIDYIELNEENYNKYSPSRISNISKNSDGTYTITSRVYTTVQLPMLSKNEVDKLENGENVKILGWTLKKDHSGEEYNGGHNFLITSIDKNNWMKLFVDKNNDGTANLMEYSQFKIAKVTDTYMRTIVNASVLGDDVSEFSSDENNSSEYTFLTYSEKISFKNGKVCYIEWTGI